MYLIKIDSPRSQNDIFQNCKKKHALNQKTFDSVFKDLFTREFIKRISISESRFAYEITQKGKNMFRTVFDPANEPFMDLFFDYKTGGET